MIFNVVIIVNPCAVQVKVNIAGRIRIVTAVIVGATVFVCARFVVNLVNQPLHKGF